jgi:integrase
MAGFRKLPSGKWQATVRLPNGQRITHTDSLKGVVKTWAAEQEAAIARGSHRNPRDGQIKLRDWRARVRAARQMDETSWMRHDSIWRTHGEPKWGDWPMAAITRMEAQEWVRELSDTPLKRYKGRWADELDIDDLDDGLPTLSPATIEGIVYSLSGLFKMALREHPPIVDINPFANLERPKLPPHKLDYFEPDEAEKLYAELGKIDFQYEVLGEIGMNVGLRPGEMFGLHTHRINPVNQTIQVIDVQTRNGLRAWPKSKKSRRIVPVPPSTFEKLQLVLIDREPGSLVFTSERGKPIHHSTFRQHVWYPAIKAAGIRRFPPHVWRHTAASWLVQAGIPLYDVQHLLGHENAKTTERYAHLAPDNHARILERWRGGGSPPAGEKTHV